MLSAAWDMSTEFRCREPDRRRCFRVAVVAAYPDRVIRRITGRYAAERKRAQEALSGSADERGRWFRRLYLFTAAVMALALVTTLVQPGWPGWTRWLFGAFLVLSLLQAAASPWIGRHSKPRRR